MDVTFDYWTNLCYCCGSNVGGTCTIDLTEDELKLFKEVNENAAKDQAEDIIEYFEGKVPEELREKIEDGIYDSFRRAEAESVLRSYGIDCLSNITEEEYNSMTMEERIERCMEEADGEMDFCIVEIKF